MTKIYLIAVFLFVCGCTTTQKTNTTTSTSAEPQALSAEETQQEKLIKELPTGKSDLGKQPLSGDVPVEVNQQVEKWIEYFTGRGREHMERYLQRSGRYIPVMKRVLSDNGMPEDLVYLALIESGFSGKIRSRAGAVGYWQFMPGTGKHYGLKRNRWIDERSDPIRSTEAAGAYLKGLYNLFGNWYLAIASYNVGENRIKNLVMRNYTRDFWELARRKALPVETQQYIPKFIAAGLIAREPDKYGFSGIDYHDELKFENLKITQAIDLTKMAAALGMTHEEFAIYNPQFITRFAPATAQEPFVIRIPQGKMKEALAGLDSSVAKDKRFPTANLSEKPSSYKKHKVKKGETLEAIAAKYELSEDELLKYNRIRGRKLKPGTSIKIPYFKASESRGTSSSSASSERPHHVVKSGETLASIARKYKMPVTKLARKNSLTSRSQIQSGQKLRL